MSQQRSNAPPGTVTAAGVMLIIQGLLGALVAGALLSLSEERGRRLLGAALARRAAAAGALGLALAVVVAALGVGVLRARGWARIGAWVTEGLVIVGSLVRVANPRGIFGLAYAVVVVVLLLTPSANDAFSDGAT